MRYANETVAGDGDTLLRARIIEDERELRYRALLRSAVLWAVIGIPTILAVAGTLLVLLGGVLARQAAP